MTGRNLKSVVAIAKHRRAALLLAAASLAMPLSAAHGNTYTWAHTNTDWANPLSWTTHVVPTAADDAVFPHIGGGYNASITSAVSARNLALNDAYYFGFASTGHLSLSGSLSIDNTSGGYAGFINTANFNIAGGIFVGLSSGSNTAGLYLSQTNINAQGGMNISAPGIVTLYNSSITCNGVINYGQIVVNSSVWNAGQIFSPGTITIDPSSVLVTDLTIPASGVFTADSASTITVSGNLTDLSTDTTTLAGTNIVLNGSAAQTITLGSTAQTVTLNSLTLGSSPITVQDSTGAPTAIKTTDLIINAASMPSITGSINVTGASSITGAQSISANFSNPSYVKTFWTDTGTGSDGNFTFSNSATYINSGELVAENDRAFTGAGSFNNSGIFRKQASGGVTQVAIPFNNINTVDGESGTIQFTAGGTDSYPVYNAASGATIDFHAGSWTNSQGDGAIFSGTGGTINVTGASYNAYGISIAPNSGSSVTVSVSAGNLSAGGMYVGLTNGGTGTLLLSGTGTVAANAYTLTVGNGTVNQSGGTLTAGALFVDTVPGSNQRSVFSGGTATFQAYSTYGGGILLGSTTSTEGNIKISGSARVESVGAEYLGLFGNGSVVQDGGNNVSDYQVTIGSQANSTGSYAISGTGRLDAHGAGMVVGYGGTATFTQGGSSTVEVQGDLHVGVATGSTGTYTLNNGILLVDNSEYIASAFAYGQYAQYAGTGNFIQHGGVHTVNNQFNVGQQPIGTGVFTIDGGTFNVYNGATVGPSGTFNHIAGTVNLNGDLTTSGGYADLAVAGTYNLGSPSLATSPVLNINHFEYVYSTSGPAALVHQFGGTHNVSGYLITGRTPGSAGNFIIDGGTLSALNVYIGGDSYTAGGTSSFTINNGGTVSVGKDASGNFTGDVHIWPQGTFTINPGGTLNTGTLTNDGLIKNNGGQLNYSGTVTGPGYIQNSGGTLTFNDGSAVDTQDVTIAGGSAVDSGSLLVGKGTGSNGILNLTGGNTTIMGTLSAGNTGTISGTGGSGAISVSGNATAYAGTILLGSTNGGSGSLAISGSGSVTVGGGLSLNDCNISGGSLQVLNQTPPVTEDPELFKAVVGGYLRNGALYISGTTALLSSPFVKLGLTAGQTGSYIQTGGVSNITDLFAIGSDVNNTTGLASGGAGIGIANISGGTTNATAVQIGGTAGGVGVVNVFSVGTLTISSGIQMQPGSSLNVSNGGTLVLMPHTGAGTASVMPGLIISSSAKFDLGNNAVDLPGANFNTVSGLIAEGYAGGTWTGNGITSSTAAGDAAHLSAVGALLNLNSGHAIFTTFDNTTVGAGDVLVSYTMYGDVNLTGGIDGSDYSRVDVAYLADRSNPYGMTGWSNGDFNYDNTVNGSDYTLMDNAFNTQGVQVSAEFAAPTAELASSSPAAVPEPATASLLGITALGLLGRRRRRRDH